MISVKQVANLYQCNYCGAIYDVTIATTYKKGNFFFCSKDCIIKYENETAKERSIFQ